MYAVHFGFAARAEAQTLMGLNMTQDGFTDIVLNMEAMLKIAFTGLRHGARMEGKPFIKSYYQWADELPKVPDYMDLVSKIIAVYNEESTDEGN